MSLCWSPSCRVVPALLILSSPLVALMNAAIYIFLSSSERPPWEWSGMASILLFSTRCRLLWAAAPHRFTLGTAFSPSCRLVSRGSLITPSMVGGRGRHQRHLRRRHPYPSTAFCRISSPASLGRHRGRRPRFPPFLETPPPLPPQTRRPFRPRQRRSRRWTTYAATSGTHFSSCCLWVAREPTSRSARFLMVRISSILLGNIRKRS